MKTASIAKENSIERYAIESYSQTVSTELVLSSSEEADMMACVASQFSSELPTIKSLTTGETLATYFRGKKVILLGAGTPISKDIAKKYGEFIWRAISSKHDDLSSLSRKLKPTEPEKETIKRLQVEISDILNQLEIPLSEFPNSFEMLVFKYINSKRYKNRTVKRPENLNYSDGQERRILYEGYILTGEYACRHGWEIDA